MRIHVFCVDLPPMAGNAVSGGGLRNGQIIDFLRSRGHQVSFSAVANDLNMAGHNVARHGGDVASQLAQIYENNAEAVYYCYPIHCALTKELKRNLGLKVFVDVNGPIFIEHALWQGGNYYPCYCKFAETLTLADEITVVIDQQLPMVQTALASQGRLWAPPPIHILPLDLGVPSLERHLSEEPLFMAAGGIFPWQKPFNGIKAVIDALESLGRGKFVVVGGAHRGDPRGPELQAWFEELQQKHSCFQWKSFMPWAELVASYEPVWAMVELFDRNIEREMAVTTRTWEQLSRGLPILYNDYSILADFIADRQAGWTVDPGNARQIAATIAEISGNRDDVLVRGQRARASTQDFIAANRAGFSSQLI